MKTRNPMAQDLRTPKYRKRIVRSRKAYTRKAKHRKQEGGVQSSAFFAL